MATNPINITSSLSEDSLEVYKLLVSSVRDYAIFLLDTEGHVCTWNIGAQNAKLYNAEDIIGKHFSVFYTPEDLAVDLPYKLLEIAIEYGRVEDEGWRVRKDGTRFWADVVLTTLRDDSGKHVGFAKITRDLTEKRHLVNEREEALQASSAKSAFLANMSHELRTPLTAIIGYAEMLDELATEVDPETLREHLSKILYSGRHLLSVISDILDLSKVEAGRLELQFTEVDLKELLQELLDNITPLAACNSNTISLSVVDDLPIMMTDRTRLRQILYNLVSNAAKFTHHGEINVDVRLDPHRPHFVVISIQDTGVGMTAQETTVIFDRFRQVEVHTNTYNKGGTGLGLAICKTLTKAMGGIIYAESEVGKGSTFTVKLPLQPAEFK